MTINELASLLNLSKTTVSRALAGYDDVSEATRARVAAAAKQHGYLPNPTAQRLKKKGRSETIGLVMPTAPGQFADPFFTELLAGVGEALAASGYDLVVMAAAVGDAELDAYRRLVKSRRVDGLIVGRPRRHDPRVGFLLDQGFPFVLHGRTDERRPYAYVDVDGESAFRIAAGRLIELGHRRIAFVDEAPELMSGVHRFAGYRRALAEMGIAFDERLLTYGAMSAEGGFRATLELMQRRPPPTAILCATDRMAVGCLGALRELGLAPGRDVSVIGYDNLPLARFTDPPLTTMHQPIRETGQRLVSMLLAIIAGERSAQDLQEVWDATLVVRGSDGPCRRDPPHDVGAGAAGS